MKHSVNQVVHLVDPLVDHLMNIHLNVLEDLVVPLTAPTVPLLHWITPLELVQDAVWEPSPMSEVDRAGMVYLKKEGLM